MRIAIIDGHPDVEARRFCRALCEAYAEGAKEAGHAVVRLSVAGMGLPPLASAGEWRGNEAADGVARAQDAIASADHVVVVFPLWLGAMPAALKAFFEQVFRPGFAIGEDKPTLWPGLLKGRSARVVVTMGMPAMVFRLYFLSHGLKCLTRNILGFSGLGPVRSTVIGGVEELGETGRARWLGRMREMGRGGR